ncbi:MAG: hypothetical protein AMXMBFR13_23530, partial [Phycisphaerae bacterium]
SPPVSISTASCGSIATSSRRWICPAKCTMSSSC